MAYILYILTSTHALETYLMKKRRISGKKIGVIAVVIIFIFALVYTVTFDIEVETEVMEKNITGDIISNN